MYEIDPNLEQFATAEQWKKLKALEKFGSIRLAAKELGLAHNTIWVAKKAVEKKAAKHGYAPDHDLRNPVPDGFHVKGYSLLRDAKTGDAKLIWEKAERSKEDYESAIMAIVDGFKGDIPKVKRTDASLANYSDDTMSVIPMGDPHFGMYAWADESGEDFNLEIAERDLCSAVEYLVSQSPTSERCVIINLGDFFHCDNLKNQTSQSGHALDVSGRLPEVVRVGVRALRKAVDTALTRHKTVEIINAIGNHDGVLAMALAVILKIAYENEPRVIVHSQPTPRHYIRHGKVLIGVTHGDRTKDADLPGIMATEQPELWGQTKHRVFYRGHHHHDNLKMYNGCIVEQFSTLAPNDAWHNAGGYLSSRGMRLIVHHKEYGEVARSNCSIDLVRQAII